MGLVMKMLRGCLQVIGGLVVVLFVLGLALGALGRGKSDSTTTVPEVVEEQVETTSNADVEKESSEKSEAAAEPETAPEPESSANESKVDETLIRPEFKEAMDSYEAFFDEYVDYMKAYQDDPTNTELLMGLSSLMSQEAEMLSAFEEWENSGNMTTAESAYYLEVSSRIYAKLAEVM